MTNFLTRDRDFYRSFFSLTGMMALQNVITCSVSLADNIMLGAYSENALSGAALANQIQFLLQMLTMGVGEGIMVMGAQYWGKRDVDSIRRILSIGLRLGLVVAFAMWFVVFFFTEPCLRLFTNDQGVIAEGARYLKVVCFSYFFFTMTNILLCSLRGVETVRIGFFVSASTLCINVCLNSILIYGKLGFPTLGAQGAAIATLTSRVVELIIMIVYLSRIDQKLHLRLRHLKILDAQLMKDYLRTGTPVICSNAIWGVAMGVQTSILGHLGAQAIAANSVATTVFQILTVVTYGSASASGVMTGKVVGSGQMEKLREYTHTFQVLFLCIGVLTGLGLFLAKDAILTIYAISGETKELAGQFMNVLSITVIGTAYQCPCLTGIVRGGGDTRFVLYNDTIFMWGIVLPCSALAAFVFHWSPVAVFICLKSDQILKCAVAVVKTNRYTWVKRLTRDRAETTE
ncbi:MAG: MATE family efflux transporter [Massiliimalia sp.]|jgi:putative MATE family efflux protein